jgi:hypothetical protein
MSPTHVHTWVDQPDYSKKCDCGKTPRDECKYGHSRDEGNYRVDANGIRRCKVCERARNAAYRAAQSAEKHEQSKARVRQSSQRLRDSRRKAVFDHYGRECACCNESHPVFLTIDHVGGGGAEHRRELNYNNPRVGGSHTTYRWLVDQGFPDGFQTLCFNCNYAKHRLGECPHR